MAKKELYVYIHYPFCKSKCPYCDFNSHLQEKTDFQEFKDAYFQEIDFFRKKTGPRIVKTIFFGGGTPSLAPNWLINDIIVKIKEEYEVDKNCEVTIEANPTSFEASKFLGFKDIGINRISLGVQALNDKDLKFLGRNHSSKEAISAIEILAKNYDNFSFDLIYTRPNQEIKSWQKELDLAISFGTKHLSLYQLTIEKGTKFFTDFKNNKFQLPDDNISADLYQITNDVMQKNGFGHYEISNYAFKNYESQHNLAYWTGQDYIGIGAGAHSRLYFKNEEQRTEIMMIHNPKKWCNTANKRGEAIQKISKIDKKTILEEFLMMGLRLKQGINNKDFKRHFNKNILDFFDNQKLNDLKKLGLIDFSDKYIKIKEDKRIIANAVILKILEIFSA